MKPHWGTDLTGRSADAWEVTHPLEAVPAGTGKPTQVPGARQVLDASVRRLRSTFRRRWWAGPSVRSLAVGPGRWLILALGVILAYELFFTGLIHDARQRDLAADFARPIPKVQRGEAAAVIQIEKIQLNEMIVEGDSPTQLRAGPAHRMGTPLPGEPGNSLILGRRGRYGGPFASLDQLSKGDRVVIKPRTGPAVAFESRARGERRASSRGAPPPRSAASPW